MFTTIPDPLLIHFLHGANEVRLLLKALEAVAGYLQAGLAG